MFSDLKIAVRSLRKTPTLTIVAILTIAIGIGFNATNFSLVQHILLRPTELPDLDRLVTIQDNGQEPPFQHNIALRTWRDFREEAHSYSGLALYQNWQLNLTGTGAAEQLGMAQVSPEFFSVVATQAALGRTFAPDEVKGQKDHVVILSDGLWRRRFASDAGIVGKAIQLDGVSFTIVGVMPKSFRTPFTAELWIPYQFDISPPESRTARFYHVIGRLKPGATLAQADAEMRALSQRHAQLYPQSDAGHMLRVVTLVHDLTNSFEYYRSFVWGMTLATGFVLLIVCANIANLLLARGSTRRREMAVRVAVGASRLQLIRLLLLESIVLSVIAGGLSILISLWAIDFIRDAVPAIYAHDTPGWEALAMDRGVLVFTLGVTLLTALGFGVVPALSASHANLDQALRAGDRTISASRRMHRLRGALAAVQIALAVALLCSTGALVKGFVRQANPRRGLEPRGLLTFGVSLPEASYGKPEQILDFQRRAVEALRAIPNVVDAAATDCIPWGCGEPEKRNFAVVGRPPSRPGEMPSLALIPAQANYLGLLGVPILEGRGLSPADDRPDAEPVGVVSRSFAQRHFPDGGAIGAHLDLPIVVGKPVTRFRVVGVAGDVYQHAYKREAPPTLYVTYAHEPFSGFAMVMRVPGEPLAWANAARNAIAKVDPAIPLVYMRSLEQVLADQVSPGRMVAIMMLALGFVALLLAAMGIYGVISYLVAQRQQEIGIRIALGAPPARVLRMMMTRGAWMVALGVLFGLPGAMVLARLLSASILDMVDAEPAVYVTMTLIVVAIALLGTLVPARRATRVNPMIAMRGE
jgi:predicted permease